MPRLIQPPAANATFNTHTCLTSCLIWSNLHAIRCWCHLLLTLLPHRAPEGKSPGMWSRQVWVYKCVARPFANKVFAVLLAITSLLLIWGEVTIPVVSGSYASKKQTAPLGRASRKAQKKGHEELKGGERGGMGTRRGHRGGM